MANGGSSPSWGWPTDLDFDDAAFDAAFTNYTAPSTSRPAFFNSILNSNTETPEDSAGPSDMRPRRASRLANGYVDLTSEPDVPQTRKRRGSLTDEPSTKRRRPSGPTVNSTPESGRDAPPNYETVEVLDLSKEPQDIQQVLQKQRAEAVAAQKPEEEEATTFNKLTCVICMDTPTDITATSCGHLFCHSCLMEALIAGENRTQPGEQRKSQCPVCRKILNRNKASDIIPLLLMKKGLAPQPRKITSASAGKVK